MLIISLTVLYCTQHNIILYHIYKLATVLLVKQSGRTPPGGPREKGTRDGRTRTDGGYKERTRVSRRCRTQVLNGGDVRPSLFSPSFQRSRRDRNVIHKWTDRSTQSSRLEFWSTSHTGSDSIINLWVQTADTRPCQSLILQDRSSDEVAFCRIKSFRPGLNPGPHGIKIRMSV